MTRRLKRTSASRTSRTRRIPSIDSGRVCDSPALLATARTRTSRLIPFRKTTGGVRVHLMYIISSHVLPLPRYSCTAATADRFLKINCCIMQFGSRCDVNPISSAPLREGACGPRVPTNNAYTYTGWFIEQVHPHFYFHDASIWKCCFLEFVNVYICLKTVFPHSWDFSHHLIV